MNYTNYIPNNIESSIFEDRISEFANLNSSAISDLFWDSYPNHHSSEVKFIQHDPSEPRCAMIGNTFFFPTILHDIHWLSYQIDCMLSPLGQIGLTTKSCTYRNSMFDWITIDLEQPALHLVGLIIA